MTQAPAYMGNGMRAALRPNFHYSFIIEPNSTSSKWTAAFQGFPSSNTASTEARLILAEIQSQTYPSWTTLAKRELAAMAQAEPNLKMAFDLAEMVLLALSDVELKPDRITPSSEDGVSFYFLRDNGYAMIECLTSKEITALTKDKTSGHRDVWEIDQTEEALRLAASQIRSFVIGIQYEYPAASSGLA